MYYNVDRGIYNINLNKINKKEEMQKGFPNALFLENNEKEAILKVVELNNKNKL